MEHFAIDDLLDFTKEEDDEIVSGDVFPSADVEHYTPPLFSGQFSGEYSFSGAGDGDILVSCDDMEELEWLSNFVEESFSSIDFNLTNKQEQVAPISNTLSHLLRPEAAAPARARRSKRSRAASCEWSSPFKKTEIFDGERKCMHCSTEKTPQWRTGPMGAKTLCNACGVRFKSGRLVPEYRPAASPTFISTEHSNSHRKVVELRRQKEFEHVRRRESHVFDSSHGNSTLYSLSDGGGCLVHHLDGGSDYRHVF